MNSLKFPSVAPKLDRQDTVYCSGCKTFHSVNSVEFVNISEGMMGEDRLTFVCPVNNETYTGTVYG